MKKTRPSEVEEIELTPIDKVKYSGSYVLYGQSGSGKTTLAGSFPKPMLYVNVRDNGTDSIADIDGIQVYEIETVEDVERLKMWLRKNKRKFKSLVIDTMSQLQEVYVESIGDANAKKKDLKPGDWGSMSKADWGNVAGEMKALVIEWRDLPLETVFIAQHKNFTFDDDGGAEGQLMPEVGPRLMPSVAAVMNAAVSTIGNTFVRRKVIKKKDPENPKKIKTTEKNVYCLRLGPSPVFLTKVRKPKSVTAPDFIENPDYEAILAVIQGD